MFRKDFDIKSERMDRYKIKGEAENFFCFDSAMNRVKKIIIE